MPRISIVITVIVLLATAASVDCSSDATQPGTTTASPEASAEDVQPDQLAIRRDAIETAYPQFKDFEYQESFAGTSIKTEVYDSDYYYAYMVLGSGLPVAQATCFRVDRSGRVFQVGIFPDPLDSYVGYRDVDPRNCHGIK